MGRDFIDQIPEGMLYVDDAANPIGINPRAEVLGVCVLTQPDDGVIIFIEVFGMTQTWALTAAIFLLGGFLGYAVRILTAEIYVEDDDNPQSELDEAIAKAKSLSPSPTEEAILKNLERNSRR